jgi:hypothetical protein
MTASLPTMISARKRRMARSRAASQRSAISSRPTPRACMWSTTAIAASAVSPSRARRTKRATPMGSIVPSPASRHAERATWSMPSVCTKRSSTLAGIRGMGVKKRR